MSSVEEEPWADQKNSAEPPVPEAGEEEGDLDGPASGLEDSPSVEIEKWKDVAARAQADLDNFRKRMARERTESIQYANRSLLEQLLPIVDSFEMGLQMATQAEGESSMILQGLTMVQKQIRDFLGNEGVETVPSDGFVFDPNIHEAIKQESHPTTPEGIILYTLRPGYRLRERLLRAANVVVSSGPASDSAE